LLHNIPQDVKEQNSEIPWKQMAGLRDDDQENTVIY